MQETPTVQTRDETLFPFLTVDEAARRMGVSRAAIYRLMRAGDIRWAPMGGRRVVPVAEISRYAATLLEHTRGGAT